MSDEEFHRAARRAGSSLADLERDEAIAVSCRGSGNPALLAWLAESAGLDPHTRVIDIGAGTGGPAAWLTDHYGATVVAVDPVPEACATARGVFGLAAIVARGDAVPVRADRFDAAVLLGVLSVVDDPAAVLREARRLAPTLLSITYTATSGVDERIGGSRFPSRSRLHHLLTSTGWSIDAGPASPSLPPPPTWQVDDETVPDADEAAVRRAIGDGRIEPVILTGSRVR